MLLDFRGIKEAEKHRLEFRIEKADQEIDLYKKEQLVKLDEELAQKRIGYKEKIADLAKTVADQTAEYEHEFHAKKEELGIEIAKLEAKKEFLEKDISLIEETLDENASQKKFKDIIKNKDDEISRLNKIVEDLIQALPKELTINNLGTTK